jgi:hypothetical protein
MTRRPEDEQTTSLFHEPLALAARNTEVNEVTS